MSLTAKQQRFCEEYIIDLNGTQAAIRAGYSEKTAAEIGYENLKKPQIAEFLQGLMDARSKRTEITADSVLQEIAKLGFGNVKNLYGEGGNLLKVTDLPLAVTATIQEITEETIGTGDSVMLRRKYKVADKGQNLERLGKHLKLFTDKVENTGTMTVTIASDDSEVL